MGRTLQIPVARAFLPILQPARYKGVFGGRGSAKSHEFAKLLIDRCLEKSTRAVCVREVQKSLEQSVKRLLEDKIDEFGLRNEFKVMNTHIEGPDEGIIIFQGMQSHTAVSIKSLEGYDIAWVEEAQALSQNSLTLLRPTIRKPGSELWFSWNPGLPTDPVDNFFRGNAPRDSSKPPWEKPPDSILVQTTYRDNPWLPQVLRTEMEWDQRIDPDKYAYVWLGSYETKSESRVFKNWRKEEFETPANVLFRYGADWGYSIDPSTLVRCFEVLPTAAELAANPKARKKLYIDREAYKIGCEIDHLPALFDSMDDKQARLWPIIADSARPETISYLNRNGYPLMKAATKGPNSVKEGVIFLQGYEIIIHPRCIHTIDEFTLYSYKTDPLTGEITPILEDKKNHIIDPVRYAAEPLRKGTMAMRESVWG